MAGKRYEANMVRMRNPYPLVRCVPCQYSREGQPFNADIRLPFIYEEPELDWTARRYRECPMHLTERRGLRSSNRVAIDPSQVHS